MQEDRSVASSTQANGYAESLAELLKEIQSGRETAAARLHDKYVNRLAVLASSRIGKRFRSKIAPEDIVQSVFATFFRRNRNGDFICPEWNDLWALLAKITVNKCLVKITRLSTSKRNVSRELKGGVSHSLAKQCVDDQPSAHEVVVFNETLDGLLNSIPPLWARMVLLRLQGMSSFEICEELGCSERTVYRNMKNVKRLLREQTSDAAQLDFDSLPDCHELNRAVRPDH